MVPPLQRAPTDKLISLVSGRSDLLLPLLHCIVQLLLGKELLMKYHLCSFFYTKMVQCFLSKNGHEIIHFSVTLNVIHPYTWIVINWPYDILEHHHPSPTGHERVKLDYTSTHPYLHKNGMTFCFMFD